MSEKQTINNLKTFFDSINIPYCIKESEKIIYKNKYYDLINNNHIGANIFLYKNKYYQKIVQNNIVNNKVYIITFFFEVSNLMNQITGLEEENKSLKKDLITGLATRSEIENYITTIRNDSIIVMCDIDNFKNVNDKYGHFKGDKVLRKLGEIIKENIKSDTQKNFAGRYGGEEFLIIFEGNDIKYVKNKTEYINQQFNKCGIVDNLSFSAGISLFTNNKHIKQAIEEADLALYEAKRTGKNKSVVYTDIFKLN